MYAVVGCNDCSSLWVVEGRPETTQCPSCGKRHRFGRLKQFHASEDADEAKQARAALLANRQGFDEAFADLDHFADMARRLDEAGVDDETYLREKGVDADDVAAAGDRASEGTGGSNSRKAVVREAIEACDPATEDEVVAYAVERGVPASAARNLLEKLVRAGAALRDGDAYRLV
jgi:hypothetical protein